MSTSGLRRSVVDKKVKYVQDLAKKLPKIHKDLGVEGPTIPAVHTRRIETKLLKYELARVNLEKTAYQGELEEKNMLTSMQQQKRKEALRKLQENKEFMQEWEKEGRKNWRVN